jgi:cyclic pyranopterin phosphate synthase
MGRGAANSMTMNGAQTRNFDAAAGRPSLVDPFGRDISYLRVSVTDRCDFRCVYCMAENMSFLPKADVLTLEELDRLCSAFVARGVRKLRLTGGEPLVRRGIMTLVNSLSRHLSSSGRDQDRRRAAHQRFARYLGCQQIPRHHPLG